MTAPRPLRFGIPAGPVDIPYSARREYWREAERLGYDWASVGDHLMPNPVFGAHDIDPWKHGVVDIFSLSCVSPFLNSASYQSLTHLSFL